MCFFLSLSNTSLGEQKLLNKFIKCFSHKRQIDFPNPLHGIPTSTLKFTPFTSHIQLPLRFTYDTSPEPPEATEHSILGCLSAHSKPSISNQPTLKTIQHHGLGKTPTHLLHVHTQCHRHIMFLPK